MGSAERQSVRSESPDRVGNGPSSAASEIRRLSYGKFTSRAMLSEKFVAKSRAPREDSESRRDWDTADFNRVLRDVHMLSPLEMRDREIELAGKGRWNPCFPITRWGIHGSHMAVAARPSTPPS